MASKKDVGRWRLSRILWFACPVVVLLVWFVTPSGAPFKQRAMWQQLASPGVLSRAHAHLEGKCGACHTPVRGVEAARCIVCHANDESILQRQPTSFHSNVGNCKSCHFEHRGRSHRPTQMNHETLSRIGLAFLEHSGADSEGASIGRQLRYISRMARPAAARVSSLEALLNCLSCHANDDRHFGLFGRDCAECHSTDKWVIPSFRHPSPASTDCAQCHQAPPSHYMGHFKMISARVAGKPRARVDQCFSCHQTTSWIDILGAGLYKHH